MGEINKITQHPELLNVLSHRTDHYGESILRKTLKKISFAEELAEAFSGRNGSPVGAIKGRASILSYKLP